MQAMERPVEEKRGIKRPIEQCGEEEIELPETASEKIEKVEPIGSVPLELLYLPLEIIREIIKALTVAKGATEMNSLYKAAENIRNTFLSNKSLKELINDERVTDFLIKYLAEHYTGNNLVQAAIALATDAASKWLSAHYDDEEVMADAFIQLMIASGNNQIGIVRLLLHYIPYGHPLVNKAAAPLITATTSNYRDIVRLLIAAGVNVNLKDNTGSSALLCAVQNNHKELVDILLAAGADVDAQDKSNTNSLMVAAQAAYEQIFDKLLAAHAAVDVPDDNEEVVLHYAIIGQNANIVKKLLKIPNIDIDPRDAERKTPLMLAAERNFEIVKLLVENGADVNAIDEDGYSVFSYAEHSNHPDKIKVINFLGSVSNFV